MIIKIEKVIVANDSRWKGFCLAEMININGTDLLKKFGEPYYYEDKDKFMYKSNVCWHGYFVGENENNLFPFTLRDYKPEDEDFLVSQDWSFGLKMGISDTEKKFLIKKLIEYFQCEA